VVAAGARRIVVVRALTEAPDPEAAARTLRGALTGEEARVGTA
jgi:thiamine-phosphate pyrophosphorylase